MEPRKSVLGSKEAKQGSGSEAGAASPSAMSLPEFLAEAELSHYLSAIRNELKITCVEHLKYVKEEDLEAVGMTRPEMRRLKKFYKKEHPQGTLGKLKRAIMRTGGGDTVQQRSLSPSPPEHRISRPVSAMMRPPGKQLIPTESISINKRLGEGEFGIVQQAVWTAENGEKVPVAVKSLFREKMKVGQQEFLKEATIMQALDHENIVRVYGVANNENSIMLVTELAPLRSLLECLKEPMLRPDFPVPRLCDFAQQVCEGMAYLESKHLIHKDLAARNILVFSKSRVKIGDVGLTGALGVGKDYYQSSSTLSVKLVVAWCAPECFNFHQFTSTSDVWSFGVTLWELFTYGVQPWSGLTGHQIIEAVDEPQCQRLAQPDLCPKEYFAIMQKCWEHKSERRPTFGQLFLTLPQIRPVQVKAVKDYPSVTTEKDHLYYKNYDVLIVLDKNHSYQPSPGMWKGCLPNGKWGYFNPTHTVPYVEPKTSPISMPKTTLSRKESGRNSKRSKLRTDMIGAPQKDFRHTGHIGYDGAVFGDVSFIGDNIDKLPAKGAIGRMDRSRGSSLQSIPNRDSPDRNGVVKTSNSEDSLDKRNGYGHSWISQESLTSQDQNEGYHDIEDNSIFADFKMPDLSSSFDFGPSFMDEVLKALDEKEKQAEAASSHSFNGRDFGDDFDPNRVELEDLKTPIAEEKTPIFEEKGFSTYRDSYEDRSEVRVVMPPPLPTQPPRLDSVKEKKQAKVKPMSASEEKMMEDAINLANEVTATHAQRHSQSTSPPSSPTDSEKMDYPDHAEHLSSPSLISKLKNSMRRSPKTERKRTFSDDLPKVEVEVDVPASAQEAYNALVGRGSEIRSEEMESLSDSVFSSGVPEPYHQTELQGYPPQRVPSMTSSRGLPQPPPRPLPKPRLDTAPKKSELPIPKPRPEIVQRVEPTIRRPPDSPDVPVKEVESFIPVASSRKESQSETKEREREQLKRTIEIVRLDTPVARDEPSSPVLDVLPDTKESTPEPDSDSTRRSSASEGADSSSPKVASLLFDDDFSEPSPREIMSKLARESRMRRNMDHQRVLSGENQDSQAASIARARREPSGIPVKSAPLAGGEDVGEKDDDDEVDTNPLRMLRGGAIPIRSSRGAGNSSPAKGTTLLSSSLRYPRLGFQSGRSTSGDGDAAPKLPPRANSVCSDSERAASRLPIAGGKSGSVGAGSSGREETAPTLPPRTPLRQNSVPSLNSRPRERHNPLVYSKTVGGSVSSPTSPVPTSTVASLAPNNNPPPPLPSLGFSASFTVSSPARFPSRSLSSFTSASVPVFARSVSLHDEPCPSDLPQAPARPCPQPLSFPSPVSTGHLPSRDVSSRSDLASHDYYGVDENALDNDDDVFHSSRKPLPPSPTSPPSLPPRVGGGSQGRGAKGLEELGCRFSAHSVQCSLEQLGFYNQHDPFWVQSVRLPDRSRSHDRTLSSEEVSPLLLVNYKNSDNVSYEDLLDFGLDRQKNGEEVDTLQKILDNEVNYEVCRRTLEETRGDLGQAFKYVRLKQLLSLRLSDVHTCKRVLMAQGWNVHRAADHLLNLQRSLVSVDDDPSSPESVEV